MLKCKLFRCECGEVKAVIKGYDVVCNLDCEECPERKEDSEKEIDYESV